MNGDGLSNEDLAAISRYFEELASSETLESSPLPSADTIWWRALLEERRRKARRSIAAIETVWIGTINLSAAFAIFAIVFWAPGLLRELSFPVPLVLSAFVVLGCSTGGVLTVWSRQR